MKIEIYRPADSVVDGDLDPLTMRHVEGNFHGLTERTLLVRTPVWTKTLDDGSEEEWVGPHEWDPNGTVEALTGKLMQRPRGWPATAPKDMFIAEFTAWTDTLGDEVVTVED